MKPTSLIATNTLGMGARPGEIEACKTDPKGWILAQIQNPAPGLPARLAAQSTGALVLERKALYKKQRQQDRNIRGISEYASQQFQAELVWRHRQAVESSTSFVERWARFWGNRFTVSGRNNHLRTIAGAFLREAIRPNIFGRFEDMLKASTIHPAMLHYLDNENSVGPNSVYGQRKAGKHNENLGREILELHTLGVDGGYTIDDITALAFGLTGWTTPRNPADFKGVFRRQKHEPGPVTMLGKTYRKSGRNRLGRMLKDLARHPSTARDIAVQIARHFIAGKAQRIVIDTLADCFLETDGDLKELALCLVELDATWAQDDWMFKRPDEYIVSAGRALPDWEDHFDPVISKLLGQPLLRPPGPDGWKQTGEDWINAENIVIRLGWLRRSLDTLPSWINVEYFMEEALGGHVSGTTRTTLSQNLLRNELLTLGLMSPEFLRR